MKVWKKHFAKLVNNKWQTRGGEDDDHDLDTDEIYLLNEKQNEMSVSGYHQCPSCGVMNEFEAPDLYCNDCGWCADGDANWNNNQCKD